MSTNQLAAAAVKKDGPRPFPAMLDQLTKQVALALPKHLNAERMARLALTEFNKTKQLADCEPISIFASVIIAAQLGLEPGILGQGYLIPYKGQCQFIPGWKGLVDLAQRSGRSSVWTGAVYEGDEFDYEYGSSPSITHKPKGDEDPAKLTYVYAVGRIRGAEYPIIEVWSMAKIWKHRDRFNKVGPRHYSYANPEMYARKIPLLQVLKYLPCSVELTTATELEYAANTPKGQQLDLKQALDGQFTHVPEQEDAAAQTTSATKPEAGVDVSTGEILPQWDEKTAIAHIRAQKTIATLKAEWKVVVKDFSGTNRALPVGVEAAYNEKIEALETGDL